MDLKKLSYEERIKQALALQVSEDQLKKRLNARLNLRLIACDNEKELWSDYLYETEEEFLNPYDGVHGGIACSLLDTCGGTSIIAASGKGPSTTDLSVSYIHPMKGKSFRIHIEITLAGHRLYGVSGAIYDMDSGKLCLTGMAKYILRDEIDITKL